MNSNGDRPSLTSGKLVVDFNIDLTFFIRSRLKNGFTSDLGLTGPLTGE